MKQKLDGQNNSVLKACGRSATVFFRVTYSEVWGAWKNGTNSDVMGFCSECAHGKDDPASYNKRTGSYWNTRKVNRLRGTVGQVESSVESSVDDNARDQLLNNCKMLFLRIMSTKGHRDVQDDWPKVFEMAWDEFRVRTVMDK